MGLNNRTIGLGTMQLAGRGAWGPPPNWLEAVAFLRVAYDWGVQLFDTAWYYGPSVTHKLLAEALYPYPDDVVLVTKAGNSRRSDKSWKPALTPGGLRSACEKDLQLLRVEALPLALLRWHPRPGDGDAFAEAVGVMLRLKEAGKIRRLGLSNVEMRHVAVADATTPIAAVSNAFSLTDRRDVGILQWCKLRRVPYLPYYPLLGGDVLRRPVVELVARDLGATPAQVALAWLRLQSPVIIPIPGTRSLRHLKENVEAQQLVVPEQQMKALERLETSYAG